MSMLGILALRRSSKAASKRSPHNTAMKSSPVFPMLFSPFWTAISAFYALYLSLSSGGQAQKYFWRFLQLLFPISFPSFQKTLILRHFYLSKILFLKQKLPANKPLPGSILLFPCQYEAFPQKALPEKLRTSQAGLFAAILYFYSSIQRSVLHRAAGQRK